MNLLLTILKGVTTAFVEWLFWRVAAIMDRV